MKISPPLKALADAVEALVGAVYIDSKVQPYEIMGKPYRTLELSSPYHHVNLVRHSLNSSYHHISYHKQGDMKAIYRVVEHLQVVSSCGEDKEDSVPVV